MHKRIILILTLLLSGRAMTLAYIHRAGGLESGDPPAAWLMPLMGDAVIGVSALVIAYILWNGKGLWVWTTVIVWNAIAIWDALSAVVIHLTNPWPSFWMLELVGPAMFFAASAMHLTIIVMLCQRAVRESYFGSCMENMEVSR